MPNKQDPPEPEDEESQDDFMERCVDELMSDDDSLEEDDAQDQCQMAWDDRAAPANMHRTGAGETTFKTHVGDVEGTLVCSERRDDRPHGRYHFGVGLGYFVVLRKIRSRCFGHRSDFPIGRWSNLRVDGTALKGELVMAPEGTSPRIDELRRSSRPAFCAPSQSASVRSSGHQRKDAEGQYVGEHFIRQELIETSLVSVPANPNALAIAKSLRISADTLKQVFAEPGTEKTDAERAPRPHRRARQNPSNGKTKPMSLYSAHC